jgi:hypothetical protein
MHDLAYTMKVPGFKDKPLCQIAIPGTHDSGTYDIPTPLVPLQVPLTPDAQSAVIAAYFTGLLAQLRIRSWAVSQTMSIRNQLDAGARYIDLRVAGKECRVPKVWTETTPALCHSMKSLEVSQAIEQIRDFLTTNNREVVILDFQHFYEVSDTQHNDIIAKLQDLLGVAAVDFQQHKANVTLSQLEPEFRNSGRCIILYANDAQVNAHPKLLWPRNDSTIANPYNDSLMHDFGSMARFLSKETISQLPSLNRFLVAQAILTPSDSSYVTSTDNLIQFSAPSGKLIAEDQLNGIGANVVMVDEFDGTAARSIINNNIPPSALIFNTGEISDAGPALTGNGNRLYLTFRGTHEQHLIFVDSGDGVKWSEAKNVTADLQATEDQPASCVFRGTVYVAWKATNNKLLCCTAIDAAASVNNVVKCNNEGMTTESGPALVAFQNTLYLFWRATNQNHLVYATSRDGVTWQGSFRVGKDFNTSECGPAVTVNGNQLWAVWRATNQDHIVYTTFDGREWSDVFRVCSDFQTTKSTPAVLGSIDGNLYVAWRATSPAQTLMLARYRNGWTQPYPAVSSPYGDATTDAGPALADFQGSPMVAWWRKGTHSLSVSRIK